MSNQPVFHHLFRTQCLVDGSAYFGIRSHPNPNWGRDGNYDWAGDSAKLMAKVKQHGKDKFRVQVLETNGSREFIEKQLAKVLKDTDGHPLSLNESSAEISERNTKAASRPKTEKHKAAIAAAIVGTIDSDETRAKKSIAKKGMRWAHNPTTREEIQLEKDEELLTGFQWGRLKKADREKGPVPSPGMSDAARARFMV